MTDKRTNNKTPIRDFLAEYEDDEYASSKYDSSYKAGSFSGSYKKSEGKAGRTSLGRYDTDNLNSHGNNKRYTDENFDPFSTFGQNQERFETNKIKEFSYEGYDGDYRGYNHRSNGRLDYLDPSYDSDYSYQGEDSESLQKTLKFGSDEITLRHSNVKRTSPRVLKRGNFNFLRGFLLIILVIALIVAFAFGLSYVLNIMVERNQTDDTESVSLTNRENSNEVSLDSLMEEGKQW